MKLLSKIFFVCSLLTVTISQAQTIDTAKIEVVYLCDYVENCLEPNRKKKDLLLLQIGERYTHFSSESRRLIDSIRDANPGDYKSQLATSDGKIITPRPGETEADLKARGATMIVPPRKELPLKSGNFRYDHYFIERRSGEVLYGGRIVNLQDPQNFHWDKIAYQEVYEKPLWYITNDTCTLSNYFCQKATAHYGGRDWTVWFTPEIPIGEGPWVLRGLPGLILKAQSADKEFVFTLTSLNRASNSPIQKDEIQAYRIYHKKDVLRMKKQGLRNPYRDIEANDIELIKE